MPDKPAFPTDAYYDEKRYGVDEGMTLREYYVGQVLQRVDLAGEAWSGKVLPRHMADQIAANAVVLAEATIRALK